MSPVTGIDVFGWAIDSRRGSTAFPDGQADRCDVRPGLRTDPFEMADRTSNTFGDFILKHAFLLVPVPDEGPLVSASTKSSRRCKGPRRALETHLTQHTTQSVKAVGGPAQITQQPGTMPNT